MEDERLTPRKKQILRAIVDAHINHGEPIGSKFLSQDVSITCSPATIRNEMADLEDMGYLIQPHTSAGRVPSEQGYRFYIDSLIHQYSQTRGEIDEINEKLSYKLNEMDELLAEMSHLAASFTDYTGIAFKSGSGNARIRRFDSVALDGKSFLLVMMFGKDIVKTKTVHLNFTLSANDLRRFTDAANIYLVNLSSDQITMPLIVRMETLMGTAAAMVHPAVKAIYETMNGVDTADVKVEGVNKLLQYPEYADVEKLRGLLGVLEEKGKLMDVISNRTGNDDENVQVFIGGEDGDDAMAGSAMIFRNVKIGGKKVSVGVIGPKRMNYSKVIEMINGLASGIERIFNADPALPPPGDDKTTQ